MFFNSTPTKVLSTFVVLATCLEAVKAKSVLMKFDGAGSVTPNRFQSGIFDPAYEVNFDIPAGGRQGQLMTFTVLVKIDGSEKKVNVSSCLLSSNPAKLILRDFLEFFHRSSSAVI